MEVTDLLRQRLALAHDDGRKEFKLRIAYGVLGDGCADASHALKQFIEALGG